MADSGVTPVMAATANYDLQFNFPDPNTGDFSSYTTSNVTYDSATVTGYSLDQFVTQAIVDTATGASVDSRNLFNYRVIATDGWNPFDDKDQIDLTWELFGTGYLLGALNDARVYFPSEEIAGAYDVKNADTINMYRVINVIKGTDAVPFETAGLIAVDLTYWNWNEDATIAGKGISLVELLTNFEIDESVYNYVFTLVDDFVADGSNGPLNNTLSWADYQKAYYIFEEDASAKDKIIILGDDFTGADTNNGGSDSTAATQLYKSMKYPESIELVAVK
jgi:hypothetical protein